MHSAHCKTRTQAFHKVFLHWFKTNTTTTAASQAHSSATLVRHVPTTKTSFIVLGIFFVSARTSGHSPLVHSQEKIILTTQFLSEFYRPAKFSVQLNYFNPIRTHPPHHTQVHKQLAWVTSTQWWVNLLMLQYLWLHFTESSSNNNTRVMKVCSFKFNSFCRKI